MDGGLVWRGVEWIQGWAVGEAVSFMHNMLCAFACTRAICRASTCWEGRNEQGRAGLRAPSRLADCVGLAEGRV